MNKIVINEFVEIYETVFHVDVEDKLYTVDKKDNLIKPYTETQQFQELKKKTGC